MNFSDMITPIETLSYEELLRRSQELAPNLKLGDKVRLVAHMADDDDVFPLTGTISSIGGVFALVGFAPYYIQVTDKFGNHTYPILAARYEKVDE